MMRGLDPVAEQKEQRTRARVARILDSLDDGQLSAARSRFGLLLTTLGEKPGADDRTLVDQVGDLLSDCDPAHLWLARSAISARLPTAEQMESLLRTARLYGPWFALLPALRAVRRDERPAVVRVAAGAVTCDIHDTARTDFVSGIQRVVRAVAVRWADRDGIEFLGWSADLKALRPLPAANRTRIFGGDGDGPEDTAASEVVVPWAGTHLVPELAGDPERINRIMALARYSGCRVGVIGYDCIPLTTASSVAPGMTGMFGRYLASCRSVDRIAAISDAAATEYSGWRGMLAGVREDGPLVRGITLPVTGQAATEDALIEAERELGVTSVPMVLVVGSHEPRKNHLAVLHAAELLWREGVKFTLTLVGAGSWRAEEFYEVIDELRGVGRPVQSVRGLPDAHLWAALELAHCTVFPSLNEGFGLPVAESLAAGTPVITSNFGSTRDILAPDGVPLGGLLVDPRDDRAILDALRTMLTDRGAYDRMKVETAKHELGSWDDYAEQVWDFLVEEDGRGTRSPR